MSAPTVTQHRSIRVLHVGDLHLGVDLYGRPDLEKGYGSRVQDFLDALDRALALVPEADLVLFPGDIYRNCDPSPTIQREFAARIRRTARQVPVVMIPGNHDLPNTSGRASSVDIFRVLELENVYVLRQPEVTPVATARGEALMAPLPFFPRSRLLALEEARGKSPPELIELMRSRLLDYLKKLDSEVVAARRERGADLPAILMAHYTVGQALFGGYGRGALLAPEVELPLSEVKRDVFDYVALGHIHKQQSVPANDHTTQPPVVYPGSIERVDFGEEGEDKCVVLAEVARGNTRWRTFPLEARRFITLKVNAEEALPLESVRAAIERRRGDIEGAIVRLIYTLPPGYPNLPEREMRSMLEGAHWIAAIRRDTPPQERRGRAQALTTQLTPLEALSEYVITRPQLKPKREALLERASSLLQELTAEGGEPSR